ncbi:tRNA adenosine(34) deaminase TadA [Desulfonatronovibrio magnus]|uniref:tRNA adenosine(34) deaminase TadA n=1 Tax=Desulfonatronovibrio magnus TaxID=698827 RepID=UPI002FC3A2F4
MAFAIYVSHDQHSAFKNWHQLMQVAIDEAKLAAREGETPVGAVLVDHSSKEVISQAHNECVSKHDPTAHAEIVALRKAAQHRRNYRLKDTVLIVTLEPCIMCLGAIFHARISGLIFGARDHKAGAVISRLDINDLHWINHRIWYMDGILAHECSELLSSFFMEKRF